MAHLLHRHAGQLPAGAGGVAAAAQGLHNDLHIHLTQGPGRDIHAIILGVEHEGCLHTAEGQQFIGGLGGRHPLTGLVNGGNGQVLPVQHRPPYDGIAVDHGFQITLEHPLHILGVSPGPAQIRRRLKGAPAGAVGKALGIQHNARQQSLRLGFQQVAGLQQIPQQLRHHLAGRGGVRLVKVQGHFLNVAAASAVVVDHRHPVAAFQQRLGLHALRAVGVHHHQECVRLHP